MYIQDTSHLVVRIYKKPNILATTREDTTVVHMQPSPLGRLPAHQWSLG